MELWTQHRAAWDRSIDLGGAAPFAAERIEIPHEGTTLPGYFFCAGPEGEPWRRLRLRTRSRYGGERILDWLNTRIPA